MRSIHLDEWTFIPNSELKMGKKKMMGHAKTTHDALVSFGGFKLKYENGELVTKGISKSNNPPNGVWTKLSHSDFHARFKVLVAQPHPRAVIGFISLPCTHARMQTCRQLAHSTYDHAY